MSDSLRSLRMRRFLDTAGPSGAEPAVEEEAGEDDVRAEATGVIAESIDELSQEIRRFGREIFRVNRAGERNQELFGEAVEEIRRLSAAIALIPEQARESTEAAKFEARAEICRELLRMLDALQAGLVAADGLLAPLQAKADRASRGLAARFSETREMHEALSDAASALKQWREGHRLLTERLQSILRTAGVREIEAIGRPFDPSIHRAVSTVELPDLTPGTIVEVELPGYYLEGRILRYAEVMVAK